jgi:hypothetical protein
MSHNADHGSLNSFSIQASSVNTTLCLSMIFVICQSQTVSNCPHPTLETVHPVSLILPLPDVFPIPAFPLRPPVLQAHPEHIVITVYLSHYLT